MHSKMYPPYCKILERILLVNATNFVIKLESMASLGALSSKTIGE